MDGWDRMRKRQDREVGGWMAHGCIRAGVSVTSPGCNSLQERRTPYDGIGIRYEALVGHMVVLPVKQLRVHFFVMGRLLFQSYVVRDTCLSSFL